MSSLAIDTFVDLAKEVSTQNVTDNGQEVFYMYGHQREIANRLLEMTEDKVYKYQKYPLLVLIMPFTEKVQQDGLFSVDWNLAILDYTEETYISEDRYEKVFKPILEPIYDILIDKIQHSGLFSLVGTPEHDRIDRLFWGNEQREAYIFNDPLDAIELQNVELKILNNNC